MLTRDELILISVTMLACLAGYNMEGVAVATGPLPSLCLIVMMFLSYLSITLRDVAKTSIQCHRSVALLTIAKMIGLPLMVGIPVMAVSPEFGVVLVLMAGICSGSSCPYFGLLLKADAPLLVVLVVATSVVAPVTLPLLIRLLCDNHVEVSSWSLAFSLSFYILLPMFLAELFRKVNPKGTELLISRRKGLNVVLFAVTNFAIFANNAENISVGGAKILPCFLLSCLAAIIFMICGYVCSLHLPNKQRTAAMISFAMTNNILVIVLSGSYFGSTEILVAAMYTIPFFLVTIPIRYLSQLSKTPA